MYKCYIVENNQIYWSTDGLDKPSKRCFDEIVKRLQGIELENTPNFVTEFTCELVLNKTTYNYMKIVNTVTNQITYGFNSGIVRTLKQDMYLMKYEMDIFSTYTYETIREYNAKNYPITVNRSSYLPFQLIPYVYSLDDDILPPFREYTKIPMNQAKADRRINTTPGGKFLKGNRDVRLPENKLTLNPTGPWYETGKILITLKNDVSEAELDNSEKGANTTTFLCIDDGSQNWIDKATINQIDGDAVVCDIFKQNDLITLLPLNVQHTITYHGFGGGSSIKEFTFSDNQNYFIKNLLKRTKLLANQYVGRYVIPNYADCLRSRTKIQMITVEVTKKDGASSQKFGTCNVIMIKTHNNNIPMVIDRPKPLIYTYDYVDSINGKETQPCEYVIHKFRQASINTPGNNKSGLIDNLWLDGIDSYVGEPMTGFTLLGRNTTNRFGNVMFKSYETLPTNADSYAQFRQQQQAQLSTGLINATAQAGASFLGGVGTTAAGVATMNPLAVMGGASGIVSSIVDIASYSQSQKAMLTDKRKSATDKAIYSTSDHSSVINTYAFNPQISTFNMFNLYVKGYNNPYDYKTANKLIGENGFIVGSLQFSYSDMNSIDLKADGINNYRLTETLDTIILGPNYSESFVYGDGNFDVNYIKDVIPAAQNSIILKVADQLNKPVRFGNNGYSPNYTSTQLDSNHFVDYNARLKVSVKTTNI